MERKTRDAAPDLARTAPRAAGVAVEHPIMRLQRVAGNAAVSHLIQHWSDPNSVPVIQREDGGGGEDEVSIGKDVKVYVVDKAKEFAKDKAKTAVLGEQGEGGDGKE